MPIVEAKCIAPAFDNKHSRHYVPGYVQDYDTDNEQLNSLTAGGKYVFQYPGHENKQVQDAPVAKPVVEAKPKDKRYKPMSAEHKKRMADARAAKMAKRAELAAE